MNLELFEFPNSHQIDKDINNARFEDTFIATRSKVAEYNNDISYVPSADLTKDDLKLLKNKEF